MIKRTKFFGYIVSGIAAVFVIGGVLTVWLGAGGVSEVATDPRALYSGTSESGVALMFNVYSGTEYIPSILSTLEEKQVKATFFIGGCWAEKNEETLKSVYAAGHEIGSHGYLHRDHSKLDKRGNTDEIIVTHKLISNMLDVSMTLFAPPSGAYNAVTLDVAESLGYKTVLWSRDTIDWRDHDTDLIVSRATTKTVGGDFILMHPTKNTAEALPRIIDGLVAKNLNPGTVSDAL